MREEPNYRRRALLTPHPCMLGCMGDFVERMEESRKLAEEMIVRAEEMKDEATKIIEASKRAYEDARLKPDKHP